MRHALGRAVEEIVGLLRVELLGERGGSGDVGEEHGDRLALSGMALPGGELVVGRGGWRRRRAGNGRPRALLRVRGQRSDRLQELLAMTELDAHLLEIGLAELRKDVRVDGVVLEHGAVLAEAEALEPLNDVDGHRYL
jgi:hypothetical protein